MAKPLGMTTALVLAFLMVSTILAGITISPTDATHAPDHFPADTQGCLHVAMYPDYSFDTVNEPSAYAWAKPTTKKGEYNMRTVRVANNCNFDINEIRFLYYVRQQREVEDVTGNAPDSFVTSPTGGFNLGDIGDPIFCANPYPLNPPAPDCPIPTETVVTQVSANGITANMGPLPFYGQLNGQLTNRYQGVVVGCGLPLNTLLPPYVLPPPPPAKDHDPCTEDASVFWDSDHSTARGWTVLHDNSALLSRASQLALFGNAEFAYTRELVFKAQTAGVVQRGTATCGDRTVTDAVIPTTTTLTSTAALFASGDVNKPISGTGLPAGAVITTVNSATSVTFAPAAASPSGGPLAVTIGAPPPCGTSVLVDNNVNFYDIGVLAGMTLNILPPAGAASGQTAGRFTINSVTANSLLFSPAATCSGPSCVSSVVTGNQYTVTAPGAQNATLLRQGSLATPAGLALAQDFTIAFRVDGGASPDTMIPVQVVGYPAIYPSTPTPATPFETTCRAPAYTQWRCILPNDALAPTPCVPDPQPPPALCRNPGQGVQYGPHAIGCSGTTPPSCLDQSPSIYVATDDNTIAPSIVSTATRDSDSNGHIDRLEATFSKRIDPRTFDPMQFVIKSKARVLYATSQCPVTTAGSVDAVISCDRYEILNGFLTDHSFGGTSLDGSYSMATFMLREQPYYDTGDNPYIQFTAGNPNCAAQALPSCGVRDLAGNTLRSITGTSLEAADQSPPVLVGSWGREGFDTVDVFFSEPVEMVNPTGTNQCSPCLSNNTVTVVGGNFLANCVERGMPITINAPSPAAGTYTVWGVTADTITYSPSSNGVAPFFGRPQNGDTFMVDIVGVTACGLRLFDGGGNESSGPNPCNAVDSMDDFVSPGVPIDDRPDTRNLPAIGWHYRFTTNEDTTFNPGRTIRLGPCDTHPLKGDLLGPALAPCPPAPGICPNGPQPMIRDLREVPLHNHLPLVYQRAPYMFGTASGGSASTLTDACNCFAANAIAAGMTLHFLSGPFAGTGPYTITGPSPMTAAGPLQFSPVLSCGAACNLAGWQYWITGYSNKVWPSSDCTPAQLQAAAAAPVPACNGVEVRPSGSSRHITYPLVVQADMDISHDVMRVTFNGPVRYPRAPANKTDTGVTHTDMDVQSATGTGQGPQGFLTTMFSRADVDTIYLRTDHQARPQDVDNSPSFYKVHCQKIQGTALFDSTTIGTTLGKSSFVPCDDPDRYYGWDSDPRGIAVKPDVAVVDVTKPRIVDARTSDSNRDGWVDGVNLTFSEPVNDASYCMTVNTEPDFCPDADQQLAGMIRFHDPFSPNPYQRETRSKPMWESTPKGGFTWDTGSVGNDHKGILQLVNTTYDPNGAPIVRPRNFEEDYNAWTCLNPNQACVIDSTKQIANLWANGISVFHRQKLQSDALPHLTMPTAGLFSDMAQQPVPLVPLNHVPEYCDMFSTAMYPGFSIPTLNKDALGKCDIWAQPTVKEIHSVHMKDGAPPVVWKALTVDTPFYDRDHCHAKEKCHTDRQTDPLQAIKFGNGTIDGYRLTFSEPVIDGSFDKREWHVKGYEPASGIHNVSAMRTMDPLDTRPAIRFNDNTITVMFNETMRLEWFRLTGAGRTDRYTAADLDADGLPIPDILDAQGNMIPNVVYEALAETGADGKPILVPDTGSRPELTYTPSGGLRDHSGNPMLAFDTFGVIEEDGAAPVIVSVGGFVGEEQLFVKFSEPVDDGNRAALVRDDFNYYDNDRAGVAGKSSTEEVCHGDGDFILIKEAGCEPHPLDIALIPLGEPLTPNDRKSDTVAAVPGLIREIAPSVPVARRQAVPDVKLRLIDAVDSTPPGAIRDFHVEDALTDAGSVTLTWTAPGDDGLGNGAVVGYNLRVGNGTPIADFPSALNPTGVSFEYNPQPLADANLTQTVLVLGLQPNTTYYFMVQAVDPAGNEGPVSTSLTTHTTRDVSPPECLEQGSLTTVVACPLVITSENCPEGKVLQAKSCTFKWNGAKDDQSPRALVYKYKVSDQELDKVLTTDKSTKSTSAVVCEPAATDTSCTTKFIGNGTQYFHVAAFSGGGYTQTAHYEIIIGPQGIDVADIEAANDCIQDKVTPVRVQIGDEYFNDVRWDLEGCDLPGTLIGLDIWRKDGNTFQRVARIDGSYEELRQGNWTDGTVGANADSEYRVNMVFEGTPEQTQDDPQVGFKSLEDQTPQGIPVWAWILIGIGLALIVAGIVIYFVLRGKQQQQAGSVAYAWESANPDQIGIDEATGMPVHEVRCPSCNNPFQAIGNLPLPVTCPNCGTTGTLD